MKAKMTLDDLEKMLSEFDDISQEKQERNSFFFKGNGRTPQSNFDLSVLRAIYKCDVFFKDKTHEYIHKKTKKKLISVTTAIKKFVPPFDEQYHAKRRCEYTGENPIEVIGKWRKKAEFASKLGTYMHMYMQHWTNNRDFHIPPTDIPFYDGLDPKVEIKILKEKCKAAIRYVNEYYDCIANELLIHNDFIAGQVDYLGYAPSRDNLGIVDWKFVGKWDPQKNYGMMLGDLSHIPNNDYFKYSLQLNVYRALLEARGLSVGSMQLYIINKSSSKLVKVSRMEQEAKIIINSVKS